MFPRIITGYLYYILKALLKIAEIPLKPLVSASVKAHSIITGIYWTRLHQIVYEPYRKTHFRDTGIKHKHVISIITKLLPQKQGGKIADLGCGSGDLICELRRLGYEAFGIDLSPQSVAVCRRSCGPFCFVGDMLSEPPVEGPFDIVFSHNSFFYLHPFFYPKFFSLWSKRIKSGGALLLLGNPCMSTSSNYAKSIVRKLQLMLGLATGVYYSVQGGFWVNEKKILENAVKAGFTKMTLLKHPVLDYRCDIILFK